MHFLKPERIYSYGEKVLIGLHANLQLNNYFLIPRVRSLKLNNSRRWPFGIIVRDSFLLSEILNGMKSDFDNANFFMVQPD